MALSGLDIYKLLPKTNCRQCGLATCLAFAMQLARKSLPIEKCPFISAESRRILEEQALPPIRPVNIGYGDKQFEIGNETVIFRHEEKFRNPAAIGFIIEDSLNDEAIKKRLEEIEEMRFTRVGQELNLNLISLRQNKDGERFLKALETVTSSTGMPLMLMSGDLSALEKAAQACRQRNPLLYAAKEDNYAAAGAIAKKLNLPLVVMAQDLEKLSRISGELEKEGIKQIVLDTGAKPPAEKIWDLTQIRRQALKKKNRALGFPALAIAENEDPFREALEAGDYLAKYAGIILVKNLRKEEALSILTLRQNLYTDPQKPLQVEPKIYSVGKTDASSPVLITTNFSLSYYTVLGEVEGSKIPAHILSVDTQGMSVLTAWAAEKFNAETISRALNENRLKELSDGKNIIIPGYVAMISGELQERSGFKITVGPKEASGIPAFLKNLMRVP
ncbi:MAG: acetyl-CoA decarbonylase/synthase complex subunit gamma [Candidatus Omnitrophota bacterium]|jgi:acetyl-CoA decarbonylase/synthase complex subunit gamma